MNIPFLHAPMKTASKKPLAQSRPMLPSADAPLHLLLVEDNAADAMLTRLAIEATRIPCVITRLEKGDDVLPYLTMQGRFTQAQRPDLIMLDLGLPKQDGFEIISDLAALPPVLRSIPIIILTGYEDFDYLKEHYGLWIPAYLNKPCESADIARALLRISRDLARS